MDNSGDHYATNRSKPLLARAIGDNSVGDQPDSTRAIRVRQRNGLGGVILFAERIIGVAVLTWCGRCRGSVARIDMDLFQIKTLAQ